MPVVCWGALGMSTNDPTTISEYIQAQVRDHNWNMSAHDLPGYAIYAHRAQAVIDHVDYCITSDKITTNQIISKDFRTAYNVGQSVNGVMFNNEGIQMWKNGTRRVNISNTGNADFTGSLNIGELRYQNVFFQCLLLQADFPAISNLNYAMYFDGVRLTNSTTYEGYTAYFVGRSSRSGLISSGCMQWDLLEGSGALHPGGFTYMGFGNMPPVHTYAQGVFFMWTEDELVAFSCNNAPGGVHYFAKKLDAWYDQNGMTFRVENNDFANNAYWFINGIEVAAHKYTWGFSGTDWRFIGHHRAKYDDSSIEFEIANLIYSTYYISEEKYS